MCVCVKDAKLISLHLDLSCHNFWDLPSLPSDEEGGERSFQLMPEVGRCFLIGFLFEFMEGSWASAVNIYLAIGCWEAPEVLIDFLSLWAIRENTLGSSKNCTS